MSWICLLLFAQTFQWVAPMSLLPDSKQLIIDRFDGACAGPKMPLWSTNVVSKIEDRIIYLNSTLTAAENVDGKLTANLKIYRCGSRENLDSCEEFLHYTGLNYCQLIDDSGLVTSPMYISYKPELKCPIKKGVYRSYNSKIDTTSIIVFPLGDYYWKAKNEIFNDKKQQVFCFQTEVHGVVKRGGK